MRRADRRKAAPEETPSGTGLPVWMPALLAGSIIGGYLGSHLAIRKGNLWIKRSFEIVTILIGLKLIMG